MAKIFLEERRAAWVPRGKKKNYKVPSRINVFFLKIHTWIHFCKSSETKEDKEKKPKIYESKRERNGHIQDFLKFLLDMHILKVNSPFVYKLDLFRKMVCGFNYHLF